jgi:sugar lactone lactonase YvrE
MMSLRRRKRKSAASIIVVSTSLLLLWGKASNAFQIIEARPVAEVEAAMRMPTDAAFGETGTLYVLDGYQNRIVARYPEGEIRIFEPKGACALNRPLGITVHKGIIYVANTGNHSVSEIDAEGECLRSIRLTGKDRQTPFIPTDIAVEGASAVVVDRGSNLLDQCLYPAFDQVQAMGDFGKKGGFLNGPYLIALHHGRIYVTDMMNGRLVQLTGGGAFLKDLGERGVREGQFIRPKGVAVGPGDRVFVSDSTLGVVQVFDTEFRYLGTVGRLGKPRGFKHPAGLATYKDLLAVVEQRRNVVTVLECRNP